MNLPFGTDGNRKVFVSWQTMAPGDCIPKAAEDFARQAEEWLVKRDEEQIRSSFETARLSFEKERTEKFLVLSWVRELDKRYGITEGRELNTSAELQTGSCKGTSSGNK